MDRDKRLDLTGSLWLGGYCTGSKTAKISFSYPVSLRFNRKKSSARSVRKLVTDSSGEVKSFLPIFEIPP
jgi:hypothetical protein